MSTEQLTPTSCLVLGLLAREGPSTPYELKRHVAATLGHFWSFPHTLLYGEPARLAESRAAQRATGTGRSPAPCLHDHRGRPDALRAWLGRPSHEPTELRDPGLLQLFFARSRAARGATRDRRRSSWRSTARSLPTTKRISASSEDLAMRVRGSAPPSDGAGRPCGWASSTSAPRWTSGRASLEAPVLPRQPRPGHARRTTGRASLRERERAAHC